MAENKKSFVLYTDLIKSIEHLTNEEKGILFNHLLEYVNDLNPILEDRLVLTAWKPIELQLKRDLQKYEGSRDKQSESGAMGNLKRWHKDLYDAVVKKETTLSEALIVAKNRKESQPETPESGCEKTETEEAIEVVNIDNPNVDTETPKLLISKKQQAINKRLERQIQFGKSLEPYQSQYTREMLNEFYNYWREPTKSGHKMKWENEETWSLELRLQKWQRNDDKWNKNNPIKNEGNQLSEGAQNLKKLITNTQS